MGCWSFLLVDRQTQAAMLCANGYRFTTFQRIKLQACIEALEALQEQDLSIEIRSRHDDLIRLGQQWMWDWKQRGWHTKGNKEVNELPYVQQLMDCVESHRVSWRYIPSDSDEQGIKDGFLMAREALNLLNGGQHQLIQRRISAYPMEKLL